MESINHLLFFLGCVSVVAIPAYTLRWLVNRIISSMSSRKVVVRSMATLKEEPVKKDDTVTAAMLGFVFPIEHPVYKVYDSPAYERK